MAGLACLRLSLWKSLEVATWRRWSYRRGFWGRSRPNHPSRDIWCQFSAARSARLGTAIRDNDHARRRGETTRARAVHEAISRLLTPKKKTPEARRANVTHW